MYYHPIDRFWNIKIQLIQHDSEDICQSSDGCRICGINFKISLCVFGGKNKFISTKNPSKIPQRAGVDNIRLADLSKCIFMLKCITRLIIFPCLHEERVNWLDNYQHKNHRSIYPFPSPKKNWCHFCQSREVMNVTFCHSSCQHSVTLWWILLSIRPIRPLTLLEQLTPLTYDGGKSHSLAPSPLRY